jgi:transposase
MTWTVAIGVDTHKDTHVAVALDVLGVQLDQCVVEATLAGYKRLLSWAARLGQPAFAVEGCGSYGAGLARFLETSGCLVWECERPRRSERKRGKNDFIDAALAARHLLSGSGLSTPRGGGQREQLRLLLAERRGATQAEPARFSVYPRFRCCRGSGLRSGCGGCSSRCSSCSSCASSFWRVGLRARRV